MSPFNTTETNNGGIDGVIMLVTVWGLNYVSLINERVLTVSMSIMASASIIAYNIYRLYCDYTKRKKLRKDD